MTRTCGKPWPRWRPCPRPVRSVSSMRKAHLRDSYGGPMLNSAATATTFQMEARGIEPRSEHDSDTAPTCVDLALWSHRLGAWSALAVTSLWKLLRQPLRPQLPPARLCDT